MKKAHFWMLLVLVINAATSCTKDRDDELSLLGVWNETSPVEDRTELLFSAGNQLTIVDADGAVEIYKYRIVGNTIIFTPEGTSGVNLELEFFQIDQNTIRIENFYPQIPEAPISFIIFKRAEAGGVQ